MVRALLQGLEHVEPQKPDTLAKSIAIGNPADGPYALREVRRTGGWGETASDQEILEAVELLAEKEGIFTEPAGGTALAVAMKLVRQDRIARGDVIVVGITGNGYKALDTFSPRLRVDAVLRPKLTVFREWYERQNVAVQQTV